MAIGKVFGLFLKSLANKEVDLDSDTFKVMLCTSAYAPNQDTHQYKSQVTGEVAGTGYTAGGASLANVAATYDAATNTFKFDADDVVWPGSTFTARYAVIYDDTPSTAATKPLVGYIDFEADIPATNAPFQIVWNPAGILAQSTP
ncbi:hypothetical protein [Rhodococcus zopfii]|uniref:hypothetical protein n=1 Tax=Rhodococcus zopfii TaxID=43772 RepID=UPI00352746E0